MTDVYLQAFNEVGYHSDCTLLLLGFCTLCQCPNLCAHLGHLAAKSIAPTGLMLNLTSVTSFCLVTFQRDVSILVIILILAYEIYSEHYLNLDLDFS